MNVTPQESDQETAVSHQSPETGSQGVRPAQEVSQNPPPRAPQKPKKVTYLLAVLCLCIFLGLAGFFTLRKLSNDNRSSLGTDTASEKVVPISKTKHFSSSELQLEFDYPEDWTLTTVQPDPYPAPKAIEVFVESKPGDMRNSSGKLIKAKIILRIRMKDAGIAELSDNNSVTAAQASEPLVYTHSSPMQRKQTNLSFAHYVVSGTTVGDIEEVFVTGDTSFNKGDSVKLSAFATINPLVSLGFYNCTPDVLPDCNGEGAGGVGIGAETWATNPITTQARDIIKSFVFH